MNNAEDVIQYEMFKWVPHDLSTHEEGCDFSDDIQSIIDNLNQTAFQPQFTLYNYPLIYYVELVTIVTSHHTIYTIT